MSEDGVLTPIKKILLSRVARAERASAAGSTRILMKLGLKREERECTTKIWVLREAEKSAKESASGDYVTPATTNGRNGRLPETSLCSLQQQLLLLHSQHLMSAASLLPGLPPGKSLFCLICYDVDHWPQPVPLLIATHCLL